MAGTATLTESREKKNIDGLSYVSKIKFDWASDAAGDVSQQTTLDYDGVILFVVTVPDSGGTAPTALYDVTLTDSDGVDVLGGLGANRSATATEYLNYSSGLGAVSKSQLTLTVANAGDTKGGLVYVYIG